MSNIKQRSNKYKMVFHIWHTSSTWRASQDVESTQCRGHLRDNTNMKDNTHQVHSLQQGEYEMAIMAAK